MKKTLPILFLLFGLNNLHATNSCFYFYQNSINPLDFTFESKNIGATGPFTWDFGDGNIVTNNDSSTYHSYSTPGLYVVCLTEYDVNNVLVCQACDTINAIAPTYCNFTYAIDSVNQSITHFNSIVNGPASTYYWDFGDGTTGTGANASHAYTTPGNYTVCFSVGNLGITVCNSCKNIWAGGNLGNCTISFVPDPNNVNGFVFTSIALPNSTACIWEFGDGSVDSGFTVSNTFNTMDSFYVCARQVDNANTVLCYNCVFVYANSCKASFINYNNGLNINFHNQSIYDPQSSTTFSWDFGDGSPISNANSPLHSYLSPGTYNACLTIQTNACTDSYCSNIVVLAGPCHADFYKVQIAPFQLAVVDQASGVHLSFFWDFGDGTTDTAHYPTHNYNSIGAYTLCQTITDTFGCTSTYCDTFTVDALGNIFRTMQGFTINVISQSQLAVNEIKNQSSFIAFPNPVQTEIYLISNSNENKMDEYRLLSLPGTKVLSGKINNIENIIQIENISPGNYILEVRFEDGSKSYKKIIKN